MSAGEIGTGTPPENESPEAAIIRNAAEQRRFLLDAMVAVANGDMSVPQANAIVGLSAEVHKSIRTAWDMAVYASAVVALREHGRFTRLDSGDRNVDLP